MKNYNIKQNHDESENSVFDDEASSFEISNHSLNKRLLKSNKKLSTRKQAMRTCKSKYQGPRISCQNLDRKEDIEEIEE